MFFYGKLMLSAAKPVLHAARPMVTVATPPHSPLTHHHAPIVGGKKILSERCCSSIDDALAATPNRNRCEGLLSPQRYRTIPMIQAATKNHNKVRLKLKKHISSGGRGRNTFRQADGEGTPVEIYEIKSKSNQNVMKENPMWYSSLLFCRRARL